MTVEMLESLLARVIVKLKAASYSSDILAEYDEYWHVASPECFDLSKTPDLCVGSLRHDCNELRKVAEDGDLLLPYVDFDRLAAVLKALADALNR